MCIDCHSSLSNEIILKHLKEALDSKTKYFPITIDTIVIIYIIVQLVFQLLNQKPFPADLFHLVN